MLCVKIKSHSHSFFVLCACVFHIFNVALHEMMVQVLENGFSLWHIPHLCIFRHFNSSFSIHMNVDSHYLLFTLWMMSWERECDYFSSPTKEWIRYPSRQNSETIWHINAWRAIIDDYVIVVGLPGVNMRFNVFWIIRPIWCQHRNAPRQMDINGTLRTCYKRMASKKNENGNDAENWKASEAAQNIHVLTIEEKKNHAGQKPSTLKSDFRANFFHSRCRLQNEYVGRQKANNHRYESFVYRTNGLLEYLWLWISFNANVWIHVNLSNLTYFWWVEALYWRHFHVYIWTSVEMLFPRHSPSLLASILAHSHFVWRQCFFFGSWLSIRDNSILMVLHIVYMIHMLRGLSVIGNLETQRL